MPTFELGESIPPNTAHAVSVSLPTWKSNIGYEEGESWVISRMATGYPRFFIHKSIAQLADLIASSYGHDDQTAMLFPTPQAAQRCKAFVQEKLPASVNPKLEVIDLAPEVSEDTTSLLSQLRPTISAVLFSSEAFPTAKQYWQHTGDGISSRRAEFCTELLKNGFLKPVTQQPSLPKVDTQPLRGPKRYQATTSGQNNNPTPNTTKKNGEDARESHRFLEERFGRNLDISLVETAKSAISRRITGSVAHLESLTAESNAIPETESKDALNERDVYLFSAGMNAIFHSHRALLDCLGPRKSVNFGFPYVDTLKILQKFGPGCIFFGFASDNDLDQLERTLESGERILGLFCEFPGNPLLVSPDLRRIRALADKFNFAVVVDETIGTFANVNVLPFADIVVSSLTKVFSGESNVMGGCAILNPAGHFYAKLKASMEHVYEDSYWAEDIIFMERNSRDFLSRVNRINTNAETICEVLRNSSFVKDLFYPKFNPSRPNYDACRRPNAGYGGLLSVVFADANHAQIFYDSMDIAKGPSLGTNFTLCSPYALLAHYNELSWADEFGVNANLVRISVGLEDNDKLRDIFESALKMIPLKS